MLLIEYGANITFTDRSLKTPLHLAAQYSKTNSKLYFDFFYQNFKRKIVLIFHTDLDRLVKKIIDAGVNIDVPDNNGNSPLSEGIL